MRGTPAITADRGCANVDRLRLYTGDVDLGIGLPAGSPCFLVFFLHRTRGGDRAFDRGRRKIEDRQVCGGAATGTVETGRRKSAITTEGLFTDERRTIMR